MFVRICCYLKKFIKPSPCKNENADNRDVFLLNYFNDVVFKTQVYIKKKHFILFYRRMSYLCS